MKNLKEFIKENKVLITMIGIEIAYIGYQAWKIKNLEKRLYICQGEKTNLETTLKGMGKTLENLIYQTGKLASRNNNK